MSLEKTIRELVENPELIPPLVDSLDEAGFAKRVLLGRQRVGAARRRLQRARALKAPPDEIARLELRVAMRAEVVARSEESLAMAGAPHPTPDPERGQVLVIVRGHDPNEKLVAALVSDRQTLVCAELAKGRYALLALDKRASGLRLQIYSQREIKFIDAERFALKPNEILYRLVDLSAVQVTPPPPPPPPPDKKTMPRFTGQTEKGAVSLLREWGVKVEVIKQASTEPRGRVIGQRPEPDAALDSGSVVKLTVSEGPASIKKDS